MGKMIARQAGIAAFKSTSRAVMPEFARAMESIQPDMRQFPASMEDRFKTIDARSQVA